MESFEDKNCKSNDVSTQTDDIQPVLMLDKKWTSKYKGNYFCLKKLHQIERFIHDSLHVTSQHKFNPKYSISFSAKDEYKKEIQHSPTVKHAHVGCNLPTIPLVYVLTSVFSFDEFITCSRGCNLPTIPLVYVLTSVFSFDEIYNMLTLVVIYLPLVYVLTSVFSFDEFIRCHDFIVSLILIFVLLGLVDVFPLEQ